MLQAILIMLFAVSALNFILIWDLMNRTRRLAELNNQAAALIAKITWKLFHDA